jgi:hypothetical protein
MATPAAGIAPFFPDLTKPHCFHCYLAIIYYVKSIEIVYDVLSYAPSMGILLVNIRYRQIPKKIGECEHLTDQTLENLNGLQTYRS